MSDRTTERFKKWEERKVRSRETRNEAGNLTKMLAELEASLDPLQPTQHIQSVPQGFDVLPLSDRTKLGLTRGNYKKMTKIQSIALPWVLVGRDVLGAAKTGSGKTLCFVVPILERLLLQKWTSDEGTGAMVLTPTRELALQIFRVFQMVGYKHVTSVALLTGGRDVEEEKKRLHAISVVVGTPGRILHHLREASGLSVENLQLLVLDEADRLLDMGFRDGLTSILEYLPADRQTLLFSATQSPEVDALATISLRDPVFVCAHSDDKLAVPPPAFMSQNFIVLELHRKLDALITFLKRHVNDKIIVFASTCNQVKFMYLAISKILKKSRVPTMCLTGKMKQFRREEVFVSFCRCKSAILFCTDIAARGLDFPLIHWVIQYDCPESAQTYIHRAGRTARAGARGASLLFLTPSETPMLSYLNEKHLTLREIAIKPHMLADTHEVFVALVVQGLKYDAQKAFVAYLRSLSFAANRLIFDESSIDREQLARSFGLPSPPHVEEVSRRSAKNLPWDIVNFDTDTLKQENSDAAKSQMEPLSKREKHLKASDMHRQMLVKQRFANTSKLNDEGDDGDDFLHKKTEAVTNVPSIEGKNDLSFEERLSGLSKKKKKTWMENADLRIKELGLSKHRVFEHEDEGDHESHNAATEGSLNTGEASRTFAAELQKRLLESKEEDDQRMKMLRRRKDLKRAGKLHDKKGTAIAVATTRPHGPTEESDEAVASTGGDSSTDGEVDEDLSELLLAAKGQLYSDDEPSEDEPSEELHIRPAKHSRSEKL